MHHFLVNITCVIYSVRETFMSDDLFAMTDMGHGIAISGAYGVPNTVSGPLIAPLNYLVMYRLQAHDFRNCMLPQVLE